MECKDWKFMKNSNAYTSGYMGCAKELTTLGARENLWELTVHVGLCGDLVSITHNLLRMPKAALHLSCREFLSCINASSPITHCPH